MRFLVVFLCMGASLVLAEEFKSECLEQARYTIRFDDNDYNDHFRTHLCIAAKTAEAAQSVNECMKSVGPFINFESYHFSVYYRVAACRRGVTYQQLNETVDCLQQASHDIRFNNYHANVALSANLCAGTPNAKDSLKCFHDSQRNFTGDSFEKAYKAVKFCSLGQMNVLDEPVHPYIQLGLWRINHR